MIPTPHIEVDNKDLIAETVIISGDPLRVKMISESYLENSVVINSTRNMLGYTGVFNNKKVTVMSHGMGMPSMGIYSAELYNFYNVSNIIRIGSCGSYSSDINLYDVVLVSESFCESNYIELVTGDKLRFI